MITTENYQKYLFSLMQVMKENACILDKQLKVINFNKGFAQIIKSVHQIDLEIGYTLYNKVDQANQMYWTPKLIDALTGIQHKEIVTENTNGKNLFFEISIVPLQVEEQIVGVLVKIEDISDLKNKELNLIAFRELATNLPSTDAFFCDAELNILIAGGGEMKKYGIHHSFYEGKNLLEISNQFNMTFLNQVYKNAMIGIEGKLEFYYGTDDYLLEAIPLMDQGKVKNIIILNRNITEYKTMNRKLEQINQTKDSILGVVAHDLRNPISAILGLCEMLTNRPHLVKDYLKLIEKSGNSALSTINDLLDITELGKEDYDLPKELVEINSFIQETIQNNSLQAKNKRINIEFESGKPDLFVMLNEAKFTRVLNNLISNAIKFSFHNQSIKIKTTLHHSKVLISIADNGIGIPEKLHKTIFDKFTTAGRIGTAGERSIGLGMSIVRQIVELHDGRIWFKSTEGKGTTFFIELHSMI